MSAFHKNNGTPVTANHHLLTDILKNEFGFSGFIISDWDAVAQLVHQRVAKDGKDAAALAINAGVDMDMLSLCYIKNLEQLVAEGRVSESVIDNAVLRILTVKFRLGLFEHPYAHMRRPIPMIKLFCVPNTVRSPENLPHTASSC